MQIQKPADLARTVKTRRQAQGLTQQDIADAVGITRQSLARIERGHSGASFDTILRIFEKLGLRLEAIENEPHHNTIPILPQNDDALQKAVAARNIDTSALTAAAYRNLDTSAITEAFTAATRSTGTSALLSRWRVALDDLTGQIQETAAHSGPEPSTREARQALLNTVIEAGDPDSKDTTAAGEARPKATPDGAANG